MQCRRSPRQNHPLPYRAKLHETFSQLAKYHARADEVRAEAKRQADAAEPKRRAAAANGSLLERLVSSGQAEAVQRLLDDGVTWPKYTTFGPPVWLAVSRGHVECVRVLAAHGFDLRDHPNGAGGSGSPIGVACRRDDRECVKALLECGVSISAYDSETATETAIQYRHYELARFLIGRGVRLTHYTLREIIENDDDKGVEFYLDNGLDRFRKAHCDK